MFIFGDLNAALLRRVGEIGLFVLMSVSLSMLAIWMVGKWRARRRSQK